MTDPDPITLRLKEAELNRLRWKLVLHWLKLPLYVAAFILAIWRLVHG